MIRCIFQGAGEPSMANTYTPQVEAISPTLPSDDKSEDVTSAKSLKAKEELLGHINKVDREIGKLEQNILKLKKKQVCQMILRAIINLWHVRLLFN